MVKTIRCSVSRFLSLAQYQVLNANMFLIVEQDQYPNRRRSVPHQIFRQKCTTLNICRCYDAILTFESLLFGLEFQEKLCFGVVGKFLEYLDYNLLNDFLKGFNKDVQFISQPLLKLFNHCCCLFFRALKHKLIPYILKTNKQNIKRTSLLFGKIIRDGVFILYSMYHKNGY